MERAMFSDMLAERRRQLGYSIRQASRVLRLREDIIVAFEEGDFERMPKSGYAQGMLSSYARYLGLDASMVVEAYVEDFERYKREGRRRGVRNPAMTPSGVDATSHVQPYVPSRGLLPTSGGPAGDMGSFATTRVRARGASSLDDRVESSADYTQVRPYTELTPPKNNTRTRRVGTDEQRSDRSAAPSRTRNARNRRGSSRRVDTDSSRGDSGASRRGTRASGPRDGRGQARRDRRARRGGIPPMVFMIGGVVLVVALAIFVVLGVGSCVHREPTSSHTIPVSSADEATTEQGAQGTSNSGTGTDAATKKGDQTSSLSTSSKTDDANGSSSTKEKETSVSVSVAADAVTWLEIDCDGISEVAETITGPWQHTYTVEDSITIQAGDTTAVTVVRDGSQVQFESMASGIGTMRIQGTASSTKKDGKTSTNDTTSTKKTQTQTTSDADSSSEDYDQSYDEDDSYEEDYGSDYDEYDYYEDDYEDEQY